MEVAVECEVHPMPCVASARDSSSGLMVWEVEEDPSVPWEVVMGFNNWVVVDQVVPNISPTQLPIIITKIAASSEAPGSLLLF